MASCKGCHVAALVPLVSMEAVQLLGRLHKPFQALEQGASLKWVLLLLQPLPQLFKLSLRIFRHVACGVWSA